MTHHYCACPWCQGPKPHPRPEDQDIEQARKEYLRFIDDLQKKPIPPYTAEWETMKQDVEELKRREKAREEGARRLSRLPTI